MSFANDLIADPDLTEKIKLGSVLSKFNHKTIYTQGVEGYSDY